MTENDDGLAIPEFLRVTPEEAARRKQWWLDNPPRATSFGSEVNETTRRDRERLAAEAAAKKAEGLAQLAQWRAEHPDKVLEQVERRKLRRKLARIQTEALSKTRRRRAV